MKVFQKQRKHSLKQIITVTFITNLKGTILPMQLTCCGKTVPSLTKFHFPESFPAESIRDYQINYCSIDAFQYLHIPRRHTTTLASLTIFGGKRCQAVGEEDAFRQITSPRNVIRVKEVYLDHTKKWLFFFNFF